MVRAVLFDLDGTLFDDRQYVRAGLCAAAARLETLAGVDVTADLLDAYFREGIRERTFDRVLAARGLPLDYVPQLVAAYHAHDEPLVPYPDVTPVLEALQDAYRLGVVTGGTNGHDKLRRLGLTSYFEAVSVTEAHEPSKHAPDPFETVLDGLGVAATDAAYVGDRPSLDFPQPNRLGMYTVRVRRGQYADRVATGVARPDAVTADLSALPATLDAVLS